MSGRVRQEKTLGVIGTFVCDLIEPFAAPATRSLGGIYYTLTYLATVFDRGWLIRPVAMVGRDIFDQVCARLAPYTHIDLSLLRREERLNTQVRLTYLTANVRQEVTTEPMAPLQWEQVQAVAGCDVILVNFITGAEVTLECFAQLSQVATGLIYEDYHSLAWVRDREGRRSLWRNPNWQQWVSGADIVQMNEHEASSLLECDCPVPQERLTGLAQEALQGRAKVLLVTLAERGAFVAEKTATGVRSQLVPACHVERVVDPTGCGDAFAAGFLHHYLATGDAEAAALFANKVAAINCSLLGAENVEAIAEGVHRLHEESQSSMNHRERSAAT